MYRSVWSVLHIFRLTSHFTACCFVVRGLSWWTDRSQWQEAKRVEASAELMPVLCTGFDSSIKSSKQAHDASEGGFQAQSQRPGSMSWHGRRAPQMPSA
mmetsp:Transcript_18236/g.40840  ORF Transcript_18236/g.40840 Transcript_18236/m.40840 type:complete len:99 (+) Transcript_18236:537-833(+)